MQPSRRKFIKFVTFGVATSVVSGKLWQRELLAFCDPPDSLPANIIKVRLSDYPALAENWSSVRLGINPVTVSASDEIYPNGSFYPFLINRGDGNDFYVVDTQCRHANCVVPPYDRGVSGILCGCHGSFYMIDGTILGGPSPDSLVSYPFDFDGNDTLSIRIPCWGFHIEATALAGNNNSRFRLDFSTYPNVGYEVSFREKLTDPWVLVPFATTPTGPANQTSLTTFGVAVSIYVDRNTRTGYYAVGMKMGEV